MKADIDRFAPILREASIVPEPRNAAPGLSAHGQMRAIDFVVMQGSKTVATTDTATSETVWRKQGWAGKLADEATSAGFKGPLEIPHELRALAARSSTRDRRTRLCKTALR